MPLLLEIMGNMGLHLFNFPGCDVINFEINLIFLIKSFFYMTKKSRQKFKNFEKEKSFYVWNKTRFLVILKRRSVAKSCFRPESAPSVFSNLKSLNHLQRPCFINVSYLPGTASVQFHFTNTLYKNFFFK